MFKTGPWKELQTISDPSLKLLVADLPSQILASRESTTTRKYTDAYIRWKRWSAHHKEINTVLPVSPNHLAPYLSYLRSRSSYSALETAFYAVNWIHEIGRVANPCKDPLPRMIMESAKRAMQKPNNRKLPITKMIMKKLNEKFRTDKLLDKRFLAMSMISFFGLLRFDEVKNLKKQDLKFTSGSIEIIIRRSKTDVHGNGNIVYISKTSTDICPVNTLCDYIQSINCREDQYIFRKILVSSKKRRLSEINIPVSYSTARALLLKNLSAIKLNSSNYGLHSFRIGGATETAIAGVNDRIIKKHGRWKTNKAKDLYVRESVDAMLGVSKAIQF